MSAQLPLIAVTGRVFPLGRIERVLEPQIATPTYYLEAVNRAGGYGVVPLVEPWSSDDPDAQARARTVMAELDGLVLTGGIDVDPSLYGQERAPQTYGCDLELDHWELLLLAAAEELGRPVLAICRGIQLLNVARGGTLAQHISDQPGLLRHGIPNGGGGSPVEAVIDPDSRLGRAIGAERVTGMCHHHQAVDQLGEGLQVVARSSDGVVEALEGTDDQWLVAVQWHPEDTAGTDPAQQRLFNVFVAEAMAQAAAREATIEPVVPDRA